MEETFGPEVGAALRPVLPAVAAQTIRAIADEVPDYARPLEGAFGVTLRDGVERALRRFVDSLEHGEGQSERDRRTYVDLGRGEMRQGRTLNALLAAYRVGARVSWRGFVDAGSRAGLPPATLFALGEAIFDYIDELSGESIEGYAAEQSASAGERQRRREQLVRLLAADPPPPPDALRNAAERAGWSPPARLAVLAVDGGDPERLAARLGPGTLAAGLDETGVVLAILADPEAPGRGAQLIAALGARAAALGPAVAVADAGRSAARARRALELRRAGALGPGSGVVRAQEHAAALLLHADAELAAELAAARLAPLAALRPAARERLTATLRAWLDRQGRIDETARALDVHPQTVRYRLGQLRDALGGAIDDAEGRFELALALRVEYSAP